MMTAGIAAARPIAVASSASAMPGATTARFVVCDFEIPMNEFMIPHTVPKRPTKGEVAAMVASNPMPNRMRRASVRMISAKLDAARSLTFASLPRPSDRRTSLSAVATNVRVTLRSDWSASYDSPNERVRETVCNAWVRRRLTMNSSANLPTKIVHVTRDAKASPTMIAFTTRSAFKNIDHGDNSWIPTATPPLAVATIVSADAGCACATAISVEGVPCAPAVKQDIESTRRAQKAKRNRVSITGSVPSSFLSSSFLEQF